MDGRRLRVIQRRVWQLIFPAMRYIARQYAGVDENRSSETGYGRSSARIGDSARRTTRKAPLFSAGIDDSRDSKQFDNYRRKAKEEKFPVDFGELASRLVAGSFRECK